MQRKKKKAISVIGFITQEENNNLRYTKLYIIYLLYK